MLIMLFAICAGQGIAFLGPALNTTILDKLNQMRRIKFKFNAQTLYL